MFLTRIFYLFSSCSFFCKPQLLYCVYSCIKQKGVNKLCAKIDISVGFCKYSFPKLHVIV